MNRTQPALNTPPPLAARLQGQAQNGLRVVRSQYVTNGLTVSLGLVLIMLAIFEAAGLTTQSSLAEPRQVRPPLEPLEALQARSYQLLAQLTAVKSLLLLRRAQLDLSRWRAPRGNRPEPWLLRRLALA